MASLRRGRSRHRDDRDPTPPTRSDPGGPAGTPDVVARRELLSLELVRLQHVGHRAQQARSPRERQPQTRQHQQRANAQTQSPTPGRVQVFRSARALHLSRNEPGSGTFSTPSCMARSRASPPRRRATPGRAQIGPQRRERQHRQRLGVALTRGAPAVGRRLPDTGAGELLGSEQTAAEERRQGRQREPGLIRGRTPTSPPAR